MNNIDAVRSEYLDKIQAWVKTPMVKVLVGMRRVGKSTLLNQWATRLIEQKICTKSNLLYIECDSLEYVDLREWPQLRDLVQAFVRQNKDIFERIYAVPFSVAFAKSPSNRPSTQRKSPPKYGSSRFSLIKISAVAERAIFEGGAYL